jgi:hypothetical protein
MVGDAKVAEHQNAFRYTMFVREAHLAMMLAKI